MTIRAILLGGLLAGALLLGGCRERETGPLAVSTIGGQPRLVNPNLEPLDPSAAFMIEATAQGLVRFDAAGEIEPALAQSWIVSDDGLRYTFRLRRIEWTDGDRVTAEQVVARLRAAISPASRNPLKPVLGVVAEIVPMTDEVLEISLSSARPNFLQLLAQPEMAIVREGRGSGPYRAARQEDRAMLLRLRTFLQEEQAEEAIEPSIVLRGGRSAVAVARFAAGEADLVLGGTAGDLPVARAGSPPAAALQFDPVQGLFGLAFASARGVLAASEARRALSMAIDRASIVAALGVRNLQPRQTLVPPAIDELPEISVPDWADAPPPMRRELAARTIAERADGEPVVLRVAMPEGPGYRLIFAHLRRDWRAIGVEAEAVAHEAPADLRFVDAVAPAAIAGWYLRHFTCDRSPVCSEEADLMLTAARTAKVAEERRALLAGAEQRLAEAVPFIAIAAPVRWSLVGPRATGFRPNLFARHPAGELIAETP